MALTTKEKSFLKIQKDRGVSMEDAFTKLRKLQSSTPKKHKGYKPKLPFSDMTNIVKGGLKGLGSTIRGGSALMEKTGTYLGEGLSGLAKGKGWNATNKDAFKRKTIAEKIIPKKIVTPSNTAQKVGFGAEQIGEFFLPGGAAKEANLGRKILQGAANFGGKTAIQQGANEDVLKQARNSAILGGALPLAGTVLKGVGKMTGGVDRLVRKAVGITPDQGRKLNLIAKTKDYVTNKPIYKNVEDFLMKKGILGEGKEVIGREGMVERAKSAYESSKGNKSNIINQITQKTKNKYGKLINVLKKEYNRMDNGLLDDEIKMINNISKKKMLSAKDIDSIRYLADDLLPSGAYQGAEKAVTKSIQKNINPLRRILAEMDKTGSLRKINTDIRLLHDLVGSDKGLLIKAAEKDVLSQVLTKGALTTGASSLIPGIGQFLAPIAATEAVTSIPQVASPLARGITALGKSNITPRIINSSKNVLAGLSNR